MYLNRFWLFSLLLFSFSPLATGQKSAIVSTADSLIAMLNTSTTFQQGFTGFALFDPEKEEYLVKQESDKYFTPASNTKVMTLLAAMRILQDSMPVVFYQEKADSLAKNNQRTTIWGTGYPLLLHPDFAEHDTLNAWLKVHSKESVSFSDANYLDERFGEGWSWDDYPYGYQMEKSPLPVYGNFVQFSKVGHLGKIEVTPSYFSNTMVFDKNQRATISRFENRNIFTFGPRTLSVQNLERRIPFVTNSGIITDLMKDTLHRNITWTKERFPRNVETLYAPVPDTLYRAFMQDSDNYLAEQLLLLCSAKEYGDLNTRQVLKFIRDTLFQSKPHEIDWVDGSGLSRYNQLTPETMIWVLNELHKEMPETWLFDIFPAGGQSGTIVDWYEGPDEEPFVFAKTGTLRHIHCLSGYLKTDSGKTLIFSFMHNNFPDKISNLKKEMAVFLNWIHDRY